MRSFVTLWDALNRFIVSIEKWTLITLFVSMLFSGGLQIIARFILHKPISWSEEMLTYSFVWSSFLGASLAIESMAHFNVDVFIRRFPPQVSKVMLYLVWTIMLWFSVFLVYKGAYLTKVNAIQTMDVLPMSMMWAYAALPVSAAFMFVHILEKLLHASFLPETQEGGH